MKNSQKIAAGVLAAVVVTSGAVAVPVLHADTLTATLTASAADDAISIANGTAVPDTLEQGKGVAVQGVVSSETSNLTSVTVGIYDSNRKLVTGKSALPKATSYDISKLDAYVAFSSLAPGNYTYMVFATNATNSNYVLNSKSFTVVASGTQTPAATADSMSISNGTSLPAVLKKGKYAIVKGTVTSASSNITSLTVGIYDESNNLVTGKTVAPNAKTYNVNKLDNDIAFNKLDNGTYTYKVIASNAANKDFVVASQTFKVTADGTDGSSSTTTPSTPADAQTKDTLTVSNGTSIPESLKKGKFVTVKGTLTSGSTNITSVTVGVYDAEGKLVTGKTASPNAKTYNLNKLDSYVTFNKLDNGTYTYKVTATNSANKDFEVVSQKFAVSADGTAKPDAGTTENPTTPSTPASNTTDTITLTGGTEIPDKLEKGKCVIVKGVVTSAESNLTSLTVGIYDTNSKLVTGKTAIPNAKTYDISKLDNYIEFNKLPEGTYAYMVFANNDVNKNYVMVNKTFTVGAGGQVATDAIAVANGTDIPSSIPKGKSVSVKGTVASANSSITSLTVGVYDAEGKLVTGKTVAPNAKTYNLKNVDKYIEFNKLSAGAYTYKVIATNSANKDSVIVSQAFSVNDSSDVLTITNGTVIPDSIKKGSPVTVKGTVTSANSDITAVTVGVYDADKKLVTGKTAVPNAKTYNIGKLDNYIEFDKLTDGNYSYMVFASNAGNTNYVIVNKPFTVGNITPISNGVNSSDKGITLTGGTALPDSISKGKCVSVKGTVSSDDTIKAVTVAIYDSNNKLVLSKTVEPKAKSYDLKKIDKYIEFNKLGKGTYTYRVAVTTTANRDVTADRQVFKVS